MLAGRSVSKIVAVGATVFAAISVMGLITSIVLSGFVFDRHDAYGRIPIPGESTVYLPAGTVTVNFDVRTNGGRGTAVPPLRMNITPPPGVADPDVTDDLGSSVTLNDQVHRRVWIMRVVSEGGYRVAVRGPVDGYIEPHLTFGEDDSPSGVIWVFVALSVLSVDMAVAAWLLRRYNRRAAEKAPPAAPTAPYEPTDQGVRLEQLKTIAALRDSGALTEEEFDAEKRRILDGR